VEHLFFFSFFNNANKKILNKPRKIQTLLLNKQILCTFFIFYCSETPKILYLKEKNSCHFFQNMKSNKQILIDLVAGAKYKNKI